MRSWWKPKTSVIAAAYPIDVATYDGVVQLSGFVEDRNAAVSAEHVAESVQGVKDVKNDLRVRRP